MKKMVSSTLLSAFVFPGTGQLNNRQYVKGAIMIAAVLVSLGAFLIKVCQDVLKIISLTGEEKMSADLITQLAFQVQQQNAGIIQKLVIVLLIIWIYGIVDAYIYGKKIDQKTKLET